MGIQDAETVVSTADEAGVLPPTQRASLRAQLRGESQRHPMLAFAGRRLLIAIPILLAVTLVVFVLLQLAPGSPVDSLLGLSSTPEQKAALTHTYGFDRALPIQYAKYLGQLSRGDLGTSIPNQVSVWSMLSTAIANTLILTLASALFAVVVGAVLGSTWVFAPSKWMRSAAEAVLLLAVSIPQYVLALGFVALAATYHFLPIVGMHDVDAQGSLIDLLRHLILPAVAAGAVMVGIVGRMLRASLLDVLHAPWVITLRSRGYSRARVMGQVLLATLPSLLTVIGIQVGYLLGGVLFVEVVFSWPGLGSLIATAITSRDTPVIQGAVLVGTAAFIAINILVDLCIAGLDPRTRVQT
jgi:peptide/nickel transport system permease protein